MNTNTKKILATITPEQWAAIAEYANENVIAEKSISTTDYRRNIYLKVTNIMKEIGLPANIKGYHYFRAAVVLVYEDRSYVDSITKKLYPKIAKDFDTTPTRVERAIRHAIEHVCSVGDIDVIDKYFTYSASSGKPTNSEAIAGLAEYLKIH